MGLDRIELGRREVECQRQQEALRGRPVTRELAHHVFVQHAFVGGMLIHYRDGLVGWEDDIGIEELEKRSCRLSVVGCRTIRSE